MQTRLIQHFVDELCEAAIEASGPNYVAIQPITIWRESRMSLFQHPNSKVSFDKVILGKQSKLSFGIGIKEVVWERIKSAIEFKIEIRTSDGKLHQLFYESIDVRDKKNQRFIDFELDISRFDGQTVQVSFLTALPPLSDGSYCWAGWTDPCVSSLMAAKTPVLRQNSQRHVILLTADTLRSDSLACYGHPLIRTPNIDRLAADGVLFQHARAQSSTSLGAFASLMTGCYSYMHGIDAEWGDINTGLPNIADALKAHGYHTLVATGELEHHGHARGMVDWFDEQLPCLAMPAQTSDITIRRFVKWIDQRPDKPFFAWLQFFDVHPPAVAQKEFSKLYYNVDPSSALSTFAQEMIPRIHGVESALIFELFLESVKAETGTMSELLIQRFTDSARVLKSQQLAGPDLALLLRELGPSARLGMGEGDFGNWLMTQAQRLKSGQELDELISWMNGVLPLFAEVEGEIVSWLSGVKDFRFALAQYMSSISFLDDQIGKLVDELKARQIYEQSTIVLTAPHGEILDEHGMCFHHLFCCEEVAQIPFIFKAGRHANLSGGTQVGGVIDQIDCFPTILESLDLPLPKGVSGQSRWRNIFGCSPVIEHDSFTLGFHRSLAMVARPPFVFIESLADTYGSESWHWKKGQTGLFRIQRPMSYDEDLSSDYPEIASLLRSRLKLQLSNYMSAV